MGASSAFAMAQAVTDRQITLEQSLAWHLQSNHYPPVPTSMVEPCIAAIDAAYDDDWNAEITLPAGVSYKGSDVAPAWALISAHHLDAFIPNDDEYDNEEDYS
jgi:hypothetical protein